MFSRRKFLGCSLVGLSYSAMPRELFITGKKSDALRITFITDLHASEEPYVERAYERILKAVRREESDLIIGGGDWITNGNSISAEQAKVRFHKFKEFWQELDGPKILVPGNHDFVRQKVDGLPDLSLFNGEFENSNSDIEVGGYKILTIQSLKFSLDKEMPYIGEVDDRQLHRLKEELNKTSNQTPIILVTHVPVATLVYQMTEKSTAGAPRNRVVTNGSDVLELFKEHNLLLVLQGHLHVNEFMKWKETTFITGGALCGKWWQGSNYGTPPGFGVISLESDGVRWKYQEY